MTPEPHWRVACLERPQGRYCAFGVLTLNDHLHLQKRMILLRGDPWLRSPRTRVLVADRCLGAIWNLLPVQDCQLRIGRNPLPLLTDCEYGPRHTRARPPPGISETSR